MSDLPVLWHTCSQFSTNIAAGSCPHFWQNPVALVQPSPGSVYVEIMTCLPARQLPPHWFCSPKIQTTTQLLLPHPTEYQQSPQAQEESTIIGRTGSAALLEATLTLGTPELDSGFSYDRLHQETQAPPKHSENMLLDLQTRQLPEPLAIQYRKPERYQKPWSKTPIQQRQIQKSAPRTIIIPNPDA